MAATTALKVTGINHVVLHVTDLERSKKFYMDLLGFEDRNISAGPTMRASFLRCGIQGLDLFEVSTADVHGGEEMNHMALSVDIDNIDQAVEVLTQCGIETSDPTPRNTVFISDPDGHRIEVLPRSASERALEHQAAQSSGA
jgi:catechol 2,3-dioxygenase-like lactoylglutathione lyase family enzyme